MAPTTTTRVLHDLDRLQSIPLSILKLSEPISSALPTSPSARTSDISASSLSTTSPTALEADLEHYRELFSKLRFSYVEQVTKEKFIRAIVGDPPVIVTPAENLALERENLTAKKQLKALKVDVAATVEELETLGRELARRWERVTVETRQLKELPERIEFLEESIGQLREQVRGGDAGDGQGGREMNLPLEKTLDLVAERKRKVAELDRQLEGLRASVPRKRKEVERLGNELSALEARRANSMAAAREAKKRKEARLGGAEDDLEQRGRWWRAQEALLKRMLEIG